MNEHKKQIMTQQSVRMFGRIKFVRQTKKLLHITELILRGKEECYFEQETKKQ